ncbi:MAG TPA: M23 family metallopeptidase [Rhodocyclaceae bacterium]|jgi:murein DD-endopeptidase MepM/ murein hydrolase activator NlpD|nr:M23 family metallopeptidase [Rhodocyclaceae bacterium]
MHIILVSDRLATARTIVITGRQMLLALFGLILAIFGLSSLISFLAVQHAADVRLPVLNSVLRAIQAEETERRDTMVRENLSVMAVKLGQMQAQLSRLDSLSDRLTQSVGIKAQDMKQVADGRGGPLVREQPLTTPELEQLVDALSDRLEQRSDAMALIEAQVLETRIRHAMLPTSLPINSAWNASTYGWRIDPFTGHRAMHEGVDFPAQIGTPIYAAAAGIVTNVEQHPQYGNMVEIDHGNDISTRYAHTSQIFVQPGALVKRGQKIAAVGTTGRSTGPHLHFEVRVGGVAQNPNRFLQEAARYASK